jgi:hypothetical protein
VTDPPPKIVGTGSQDSGTPKSENLDLGQAVLHKSSRTASGKSLNIQTCVSHQLNEVRFRVRI